MVTETEESAIARRKMILRDSVAFLSLAMITLVLFGITLLLFRSFSAHRADLAHRWSQRGAEAMKANRPDQAVVALRTALSYAPDTRSYELLLAQALGQSGRIEESYSYFMGLWESQPGDGFINLELARLAARRGDRAAAVEFYRASIYGTWEGDGVSRRAQVRLELARYLIAGRQYGPARVELLIAGGNMPEGPQFDFQLGMLLEQAQDPADAWTFYGKALAIEPRNVELLDDAGRLAYEANDFEVARRLFMRAMAVRGEGARPQSAELTTMRQNAARIVELSPSPALPMREQGNRALVARRIAKSRLDRCAAQLDATSGQLPSQLQALQARWSGPAGTIGVASLRRNQGDVYTTMSLVYDTELQTASLCGPPEGDDALLLLLAKRATAPSPGPVFTGIEEQGADR